MKCIQLDPHINLKSYAYSQGLANCNSLQITDRKRNDVMSLHLLKGKQVAKYNNTENETLSTSHASITTFSFDVCHKAVSSPDFRMLG